MSAQGISEAPGISPWFSAGLGIIGAIWLYRLWRPSRDRNVAQTLYTSALAVSLLWVASFLLLPSGAPLWVKSTVSWSELLVIGLLLVGGAFRKHRDRVEGDRDRAALNLAPRRRMLSQSQLIVVWFIGGYAGLMLFLVLGAMIVVAINGGRPATRETTTQLGAVGGLAFLGVVGLAGWIHVRRRPGKIAKEDERLRRLDLGLDEDDNDSTSTMT
ncbi:hypothetical protein [Mycobacterium kansasii]|uniref:hypothetical protein n=1 Tax=Mycobacterium kansasii TaxID=1768 RepID=UPI000564C697|nr:hypothetical protein [Mycobacterium kansasii]